MRDHPMVVHLEVPARAAFPLAPEVSELAEAIDDIQLWVRVLLRPGGEHALLVRDGRLVATACRS